ALESHQKAVRAREEGFFEGEIIPLPVPPDFAKMQLIDSGPRAEQSLAALEKLRPYFDRQAGTVTVGNACPVTDGSAAVLLMSEAKAKEMGLKPLGYLRAFAYAGLDGRRMGLGPVYATSRLMERGGFTVSDFKLIEMNEAFAAQVIANERAFASEAFAKEYLGRDKALGEIDRSILNVNGGAIALGHPVGTTGTRLVITVLRELKRRSQNLGLATLCIGGGQGASLALEVE
ncbi:MAG: acetyl-CoA C-acyltransferase, partial [Planctomycetes bacterium]|nr:acetyl-CoA C-acyltransferase [Planctomycetota bacterium]